MTHEMKWICDSCKTSGITNDEFEHHNCGDEVIKLRSDLARLRELLGEVLDTAKGVPQVNSSWLISRIQSELKE